MITLSDKEFKKQINEKTPILVDFYADWCGPCRMLGPVLDEISHDKEFDGKLKFAKVNTEECPEIAQDNNVSGIPCLIIFKGGKEVSRIVGFAPKPIMKAKIMSELSKI